MKRKIFYKLGIILTIITGLFSSNQATASTPVSNCVNSLLYKESNFYFDKVRTELSENTAVDVCKGVTSKAQSASVVNCVNSLLYKESNFSFDKVRTELSENSAVVACKIPKEQLPCTQPEVRPSNSKKEL